MKRDRKEKRGGPFTGFYKITPKKIGKNNNGIVQVNVWCQFIVLTPKVRYSALFTISGKYEQKNYIQYLQQHKKNKNKQAQ